MTIPHGTPAIPFNTLIEDTIRYHGVTWAWKYYNRRGMALWEFRFWARGTLRG